MLSKAYNWGAYRFRNREAATNQRRNKVDQTHHLMGPNMVNLQATYENV